MKKALVVLLALACVAGLAFADGATASWSVSSLYGFGVNSNSVGGSVVGYDYGNVGGSRTRWTGKINSADGNVGFLGRFQVTANAPVAPTLNQLYGWGKLFNGMLTVKAGILDDYTISLGDWDCFGNLDGKTGVFFDATPIAGLDIGFYQYIPAAVSWAGADGDVVGVSFLVPNLVRVGGGVTLALQAAGAAYGHKPYVFFDVKAVPGLTLNAEAQFALYNGDTPITAAEDVGYAMGPLTVAAYIGEYMDKGGLDWGVEPRVSYKVNDNITVNAILNVYNYGNANTPSAQVFFSPVDAGALPKGAVKTMIFGGGASVNYVMGGFTLTVGDYYGADSTQGNLFYVNADVSL